MSKPRPSRSAIVVALTSVALSFVAATGVAEYNDFRIRAAAAEMIATSSGKEHLAAMRSELHRFEIALGAHGSEEAPPSPEAASRWLERVNGEWQAYRALPVFAEELELQPVLDRRLQALGESMAVLNEGVGDSAELRKHIVFDIDNIDEDLLTLFAINRRESANLVAQIDTLGHRSIVWAALLDSISILLTIVAGGLLLSVTSRYERLLAERADELDQFAGRVAHDILSPLSNVGMSMELVERATPAESGTRHALARGRRSVGRVQQLVEALLQFARSGAKPDPDARTEVRHVVEGVMEEVRPAAQAAGVIVETKSLPSCEVRCAPGNLNSILANLLSNAVKHMGESTTRKVTLSVIDEERFVCFEIEDSGPGLPPELGDRVFEPYVRGHRTDAPGVGLGLATVKRIAEAHGGRVGAESHPRQGSKFWVELPKATTPEQHGGEIGQYAPN